VIVRRSWERNALRLTAIASGVVAVFLVGWGALVGVTGGFKSTLLGIPISAHDSWRPLAIACLAACACVAASRRLGWLAVDWQQERARPVWPRLGVVAAVCFLALLIEQRSAFVAAAADASGYISQSRLWASGSRLRIEEPSSRGAPWPDPEWTLSPLGYRPATIGGSIVPTYPAGLPLLMAAGTLLAGENGIYWVVPVLGLVAVWLTFRLGAAMAGGTLEGVAAAWLLALSPTFLYQVTQPMSDVPATAGWLAALAFAWLTPGVWGAVAAGLASSMALLIRPNLVPVALAIAAAIVAARPHPVEVRRRLLGYFLGVAPGVGAIALLNRYLYGSPLASGYGSLGSLFGWETVRANAVGYSRWAIDSETPLLVVGVLAPLVVGRGWLLRSENPKYLCAVALGFAVLNVAVYLPYFHFEEWWYLRFLLPSLALGYAMMFAAVGSVAARAGGRVRIVCVAALAIALAIGDAQAWMRLDVFGPHRMMTRFLAAAEYIQRNTPDRAVVVCMEHSGSIRYYTGRTILRYDLMQPDWLDRAIAHFQDEGRPVTFVLDDSEIEPFTRRFNGHSRYASLFWKPAAVLRGAGIVLVFAAADRDAAP
jgi:hypothetical protein